MPAVDKTIYPDDTAASTAAYTVTTKRLSDIEAEALEVPDGATFWDQSIAFAMSTADFAPFNNVEAIFATQGSTTLERKTIHKSKQIQNIALYLAHNSPGLIDRGVQYYNGSVDGQFIGALHDFSCQATWRRSPLWTSTWHNWASRYDYSYYRILTGLDLPNFMGVVCVAFRNPGNFTFTSYKYYMANRQSLPHPCFAFMLGCRQLSTGESGLSTVIPVDMTPYTWDVWVWASNAWNERSWDSCSPLFPFAATPYLSPHSGTPSTPTSGALGHTVVFPLAGFMVGGEWMQYDYTGFAGTVHGGLVYGAGDYVVFEQNQDGNRFYTQLTEKAITSLMTIAATYGLPFTDDFITNIYDIHSGIECYMPIAEDTGVYNGRYELLYNSDGDYVLEDPQADAIYTGGKNAPYNDRTPDPDEQPAETEIDLVQPSITPIGAFNRTYIIDKTTVDLMQDIIYGSDDTFMDNFLAGLRNYGQNPMNAFISLHMYPFDVADFSGATVEQPIAVGKTTLRTADDIAEGLLMPPDAKAVIDCGGYKIPEYFDCYLDYEPYTTIQLYIPYIGTIELQPSLYVGKTVSVKLIVDWITGAATAVVYADGIPMIYQQGVIGMSISMTGDDSARRAMSSVGGVIGAVGSAAKAVANFMGGNAVGGSKDATDALGSLIGAATSYLPTEFQQAGSSSPICGLYMPDICYVTISRPIPGENLPSWGVLNGFACSIPGVLGYTVMALDPKGLIQCVPRDTSMNGAAAALTEAEVLELKSILSEGFRLYNLDYVPPT